MSRVFAAPRSQSWTMTRHVTSDAIQEVQWLSRLSNHIYLHGKDLFRNLWFDASPIWNEMYLKEKKILSKTKVVCNPKHALALRLKVLMLIMILKCTCSNVPKNLLIICPHPPHTPPLTTEPYCSRVSRLLHARRIRVTSLPLRKIRDCSESAFPTTIS